MTSLRQRMTEDMQVRNLSPRTQATYILQVSLFARHFHRSPEALGPEQIRAYQVFLVNQKKLAPNSVCLAVAALRFLYKITLKKGWTFERGQPERQSVTGGGIVHVDWPPKKSSCWRPQWLTYTSTRSASQAQRWIPPAMAGRG